MSGRRKVDAAILLHARSTMQKDGSAISADFGVPKLPKLTVTIDSGAPIIDRDRVSCARDPKAPGASDCQGLRPYDGNNLPVDRSSTAPDSA